MAGGKRDSRHPLDTGATPGDAKASAALGELLRAARDRRGISLDQISRETKIPTRCLAALEHGDLAALPGGTYTRGEVIAFATAVGLDKQTALDHLDRSLHPAPSSSVAEKVARAPVATTRRSTARIAAIAVLAILMTAWAAREYNARVQHQQARVVDDVQSASRGSPPPAADMPPARRAEREAAPTERSLPSTSAASTGTVAGSSPKSAPLPRSSPSPAVAEDDVNRGAPAAAADDESIPGSQVNGSAPALTVVSDPPGARVTIDGIGWGSTPVTISHVAPGAKRIRVTLSGYPAVERTVQIPTTGTTRIVIPLSAP
jgi:cytoskeletal protein RodZ